MFTSTGGNCTVLFASVLGTFVQGSGSRLFPPFRQRKQTTNAGDRHAPDCIPGRLFDALTTAPLTHTPMGIDCPQWSFWDYDDVDANFGEMLQRRGGVREGS